MSWQETCDLLIIEVNDEKKIKIILIVLMCIVIAAALLLCGFLIKQHITIKKIEKTCKMENSPVADYSSILPDKEKTYGYVKELVGMGARRPGTEAGEKARQYVKDKHEDLGLGNVQIAPSKISLWFVSKRGLTVNGKAVPSYYMSHTMTDGTLEEFSTPDGGVEAEIVYVGAGAEADFEKNMASSDLHRSRRIFSARSCRPPRICSIRREYLSSTISARRFICIRI